MSTPTPKLFPEMRLRAPGAVPPIVLLGEPGALLVLTPACELAICLVPVTSVPMKLPCTKLRVAGSE